jgi:hypothetical protein
MRMVISQNTKYYLKKILTHKKDIFTSVRKKYLKVFKFCQGVLDLYGSEIFWGVFDEKKHEK